MICNILMIYWKCREPETGNDVKIINNFELFVLVTEEYEASMKKQEATFKTEVTAVVQEPRSADVPPVTVMTMEQRTTTIISGQVPYLTSEHSRFTDVKLFCN